MEPPKKPIVAVSLNALGGFKTPPAFPPVPGTVAPGQDLPRLTEEQAAGLMKTALESMRLDQALARLAVAITNLDGIRSAILDVLNNYPAVTLSPDRAGTQWAPNDQLHAFLDEILDPPEGDHDLDAATIEAMLEMVPEQPIIEPDGE